MPRRLTIIALATYLLSLAGALIAGVNRAAAPPARTQSVHRQPATAPQQPAAQLIGMTLNVYYTSQLERDLSAIDRIKQAGFNTVQIVTPIFQTNGASASLRAPVRPGRSPAPAQLVRLLQHAHALGLRTVLMPQINFTSPRGNEWRGKIHPDNWLPWWRSYDQMINRYLNIAIQGHADVFTIGCELVSTLDGQHLDQWMKIIRRSRQRFAGNLTFSTTWDSYDRVGFWKDLDYIGISGYWNLTTNAADPKHPTPAELARRWTRIRSRLIAFSQAQHRPILFTEVGYPSLPWGLKDPWNYVNANQAAAAPRVQALGYQSFLHAWESNLTPPAAPARFHPHLAGVLFYEWNVGIKNPLDDTGYSIFGKPAFDILHHWLNRKTDTPAAENPPAHH